MTFSRISVLAILFLTLAAVPLPGQELPLQEAPVREEPVQPHPEGEEAIGRLKSPYCPGLMLEVCPSPQAKVLRDSLQAMAHQGASSDSIVEWMLTSYGEEYRAVPGTRGSGLLAWLAPPLALMAGLILVVLALRHFRGNQDVEGSREELSPEEEKVLEEALEDLKSAEEVPF
jgi:cytochrome c-type biogenesis protein CcmH